MGNVLSKTVLPVMILCATAAQASVIATTGDFTTFSSGTASYLANAYNDPDPAPIRLWMEQAGFVLSSDILLDTGLADPTKQYTPGSSSSTRVNFSAGGGPTIPAGTPVDVYFAYFEPLGDSANGSVTFDSPILGIVTYSSRLQFSDSLRVSGAPYPANPAFAARGMDGTDSGQISADRRTFTLSLTASNPGDQIRIFTDAASATTPIPEPAAEILCCGGLLALQIAARRRRRQP